MNKNLLQPERQVKSCRVGRNSKARIIRSSQIPKDFFSRQHSTANLTITNHSINVNN
jgi:hypothetical protein